MAVAEPGAGSRDTIYRRPPARPEASGSSWFNGSPPAPAGIPVGGPADGTPAASAETPSRASFGFTDSPISPVRHPASPTSPAPMSNDTPAAAVYDKTPAAPEPIAVELPIRRQSDIANRRSPLSDTAGRRPPVGDTAGRRPPVGDTAERRLPLGDTAQRRPALGDTAERRLTMSDTPPRGLDLPDAEFFARPPAEPAAKQQAAQPAVAPPARQSRGVTVGIVLLSLIVLVAGSAVGVVYFTGSDDKLDSVLQLGAGDNGKRTATAPLDNRTKASFELLAASNKVTVTIGELGDDLYRISTPEDAGFLPSPIVRNDDVKLQVTRDGDGTGGEIDVVLAAKVNWQLRFSGYAEEQTIDLSGGQISGIEMVGGMRAAELTLSRPSGTVPIKINGAVERLVVRTPADSPVRVKVGGGAQKVVAGTRTLNDVAAGSTLTPKGWAVQNRYDAVAGAPITALTVTNA
ncbi:hypothetical protein Ade02nite_22470 [Paractinoplanes deccanensis]|uniref:Adhesin domain-containing protein n=1 Tax=Paractinoplanes deccanensis TaxID=113561 RepID=A0ABQ3Y0R7_9ACTN|nr:hypothetical protein [Actinoplanes deccanensis]GID73606.1 hypothetical protein Ade02nite_22470 [Actinoplanes deccanensis]